MNNSDSHTDEWAPPPLELPPHWEQMDFEEAFENISLAGLKIPQKQYLSSGTVPVVDQGFDMIGGFTNDETKAIQPNRALIVFGDHTKCFKLVRFRFAPGADGIKVLKPIAINERFAYYACKALRIPDRGYSRHYGFLKKSKIPLPPVNEQHRIVAKIEELFSELDKGVESLKTARAKLDVYRQAVLKHAFEGKLTAQWREENKDKLEMPEQLLTRIKQEREARYEHQLREWKAAAKTWEGSGKRGKRPVKPQNPRNPLCATVSPIHNPFWTRLLLDELAVESVLGKMLDRENNTGTPRRYLGNINLRWGKFDLENLKMMKVEDSEIDRYCLARGDLVVCEGGEPGRCAVWEGQEPTMLIQKALHRVRFTEGYSPYFAFYFMTYAAKSGLLSPNLTGSTIKHLTGKGLGNVLFPLCALAEQEQIVRHLDSIVTLCDELDCQIDDQLLRVNALRQAILKKAFTGQLVPQDPNDESASILLERVKAEKAAQGHNNTRARRRRTAATA